ncbi:MAG: hypothetical protein FWD80_03360 [Propionibacteriaceae bacterium]|nr:hypothetical protein [Propionibacteriaceae bacterium]
MKKSILGIVAAVALAGGLLIAPVGGLSMSQAAPATDTCTPTANNNDQVVYTAIPGTYWVRVVTWRDDGCGARVVKSETIVNYYTPWVHGSTVVNVQHVAGGGSTGTVVTTYPCPPIWGRPFTACKTVVSW